MSPPLAPDARPLIVTEEVVAATQAEFLGMLAMIEYVPAIRLGLTLEIGLDRWGESLRRANAGQGLCLREACWLVAVEWASGRPSCWVR
jgi:hypothetical protein